MLAMQQAVASQQVEHYLLVQYHVLARLARHKLVAAAAIVEHK